MANQILDEVIDEITKTIGVEDSAIAFIDTVPRLVQAGIEAALENGATAEQLEPLSNLRAELATRRDAIVAAIAANSGGGSTPTRSTRRA